MNNYLLYPVLELKGFILLCVGALFILTFLSLYFMGRKKSGMGDFGWQALFFCMTGRELVWLTLGISQICFVFSIIFFAVPMGLVQITALTLLCVLRGVLELSAVGLAGEILYGLMTGAALFVENLLRDYMAETGVEIYIGLIWGLLCLFVLQYSIYYFIKSLERILLRHEKARKKWSQNEDDREEIQ